MSSGRIVQIIGAVIDVEFDRQSVPRIYDALKVEGTETTLEVQQQIIDFCNAKVKEIEKLEQVIADLQVKS